MKINLYSIAYPVTSLGPWQRLVIWTAGCRKRCEGCISPEMQDNNARKHIGVERLLRHFLQLNCTIDGITISGGEPFDQIEPLVLILEGISAAKPEWSVIVYSGYKIEEILENAPDALNIFRNIDVLIDGEFQKDFPSEHPLAGSGNQKIHYLTERGRAMKTAIDSLPQNRVNFGIGYKQDMLIGVINENARSIIHEGLGIGSSEWT